jgi:acetyl esterase/lipase
MKNFLFAIYIVFGIMFAAGGMGAQQSVWQPTAGHEQVRIWPGAAPDLQPVAGPETSTTDPKELIAGKTVTAVNNVTVPTMTVYSPKGKNTGAAVVVFPGGGYMILAIDLEGTEVCDWLTAKGITCVLLKYRVPAPRAKPYWGAYPESPIALEDAQGR